MDDTYSNLIKENELLRAQLAQVRDRVTRKQTLRSELHGTRTGDLLLCSQKNFDSAIATLVEPSETVIEIYGGDAPLGWLHPTVHVFLELDRNRATARAQSSPTSLVLNTTARSFFAMAAEKSVDCIVFRDLLYTGQPAAGENQSGFGQRAHSRSTVSLPESFPLIEYARCVARQQVVALCRLSVPCEVADAARLFAKPGLTYIQQGLQHLEIKDQIDFRDGVIVLNTGEPDGPIVREFAVILSTASATKDSFQAIKLVVLSGAMPERLDWSSKDIVICDLELVPEISKAPSGAVIPVPLKLLRTAMDRPPEVLRSSILNYTFLEHYLRSMPTVAIGTDAEFIVAEMQSRIGKRVAAQP
jgi:hypothetical protein